MMWIFYIDWQQYWKCDWTMDIGANLNAHGKRTVSTKQPHWVKDFRRASRLWRGIGLVFKSLHCFTVRPIFSTRPITRMKSFWFFFGGGCVLSSNAFTIWCCIPISRPPRVIRRFKRRSCHFSNTGTQDWVRNNTPTLNWISVKQWYIDG